MLFFLSFELLSKSRKREREKLKLKQKTHFLPPSSSTPSRYKLVALARIDGPSRIAVKSSQGDKEGEEGEETKTAMTTTTLGAGASGRAAASRVLGEAEDAAASAAVELRGGGLLVCEAFAFRIP